MRRLSCCSSRPKVSWTKNWTEAVLLLAAGAATLEPIDDAHAVIDRTLEGLGTPFDAIDREVVDTVFL